MSFPHEDSSHANSIDEVRAFLDENHPSQYLVFNLSGHTYDTTKLNNQVRSSAIASHFKLFSSTARMVALQSNS